MVDAPFLKGIDDLRRYFDANPAQEGGAAGNASHHLDGSKEGGKGRFYISREELQTARGKSTPEMDMVIDALEENPDLYRKLSQFDVEGKSRNNDWNQISIRDLFSVHRGYLATRTRDGQLQHRSAAQTEILSGLSAAHAVVQARRAALQAEIQKIVANAQEIRNDPTFLMVLKLKSAEHIVPESETVGGVLIELAAQAAENELKAQYRTIPVSGSEYEQRREGEILDHNVDWVQLLWGGGDDRALWTDNTVRVHKKSRRENYRYVDRNTGAMVPISQELVWREAKAQLAAESRVELSQTPDSDAAYVLETPLKRSDITRQEPLVRHFVTLQFRKWELTDGSFSSDLLQYARNMTTTHKFEVQIPPHLTSDKQLEFFNSMPNLASLVFDNWLSWMKGDVVAHRTEIDNSMQRVTLKSGRTLVISSDRLAHLPE